MDLIMMYKILNGAVLAVKEYCLQGIPVTVLDLMDLRFTRNLIRPQHDILPFHRE